MSEQRFAFGDRIMHEKRPEWGVGSITKVEELTHGGRSDQRVTVRFPGFGVRTFLVSEAALIRADGAEEGTNHEEREDSFREWSNRADGDWLAPVAKRKVQEVLIKLPDEVRDPFLTPLKRVEATLRLYRFDRSGRGLIDWAIAQTGLEDPLSRFNRHELEQFFDRWAFERDAHLGRLFSDSSLTESDRSALLGPAPRAAREAVKRLNASTTSTRS